MPPPLTAAPRVLVIGATGMLASTCASLAADGWSVVVHGRRESRAVALAETLPSTASAFSGDYLDSDFEHRLRAALSGRTLEAAILWVHGSDPEPTRRIVDAAAAAGCNDVLQVFGSRALQPGSDVLDRFRDYLAHLDILYRTVALGWTRHGGRSAWLSQDQIARGVFNAFQSSRPTSTVGEVAPWSERP